MLFEVGVDEVGVVLTVRPPVDNWDVGVAGVEA